MSYSAGPGSSPAPRPANKDSPATMRTSPSPSSRGYSTGPNSPANDSVRDSNTTPTIYTHASTHYPLYAPTHNALSAELRAHTLNAAVRSGSERLSPEIKASVRNSPTHLGVNSHAHQRRQSYIGPYQQDLASPSASGPGAMRASMKMLLTDEEDSLDGLAFQVEKCRGRARTISDAAKKVGNPVLKNNRRLLCLNSSSGALVIRKKGNKKSKGGAGQEETHAYDNYIVAKDRTDPRRICIRTEINHQTRRRGSDASEIDDESQVSTPMAADPRNRMSTPAGKFNSPSVRMDSDSEGNSDAGSVARPANHQRSMTSPNGCVGVGGTNTPTRPRTSTMTLVKKEKVKERKYQFSSTAERERFLNQLNKKWIYPPLTTQTYSESGEGDDIAAEVLSYVWKEFLYRAHTYLSVHICTWNMGDAAPPQEGLLDLCGPNPEQVHVFAFGIQECEYEPRYGYSNTEADIHGHIMSAIGRTHKRIGNVGLAVGKTLHSQIGVYVRRDIERLVTNIETSSEATGIGHVVGNKGGTAIAFSIQETNLCFVNSHLAAHQENVAQRNDNYCEIVRGLRLGTRNVQVTEQFHHLFWFGDLNYRVDLPYETAVDLAKSGKYTALLQKDQLRLEMMAEKCFVGFREGVINFPPTYRMERNQQEYSTHKLRVPSYCDRILTRSLPGYKSNNLQYTSVASVLSSDHRAVTARYSCMVAPPVLCSGVATECYFGLANVRAVGLQGKDMGGTSDPFIVIHGPFLEHVYRSKAVLKTTDPVWNDDDVPVMKPHLSTRADLYSMVFSVTILDFDVTSANDRLGNVNISCSELVTNGSIQFSLPIMLDGLSKGTLAGEARLAYEGDRYFDKMRAQYQAQEAKRGNRKTPQRLKDYMKSGPQQCSVM